MLLCSCVSSAPVYGVLVLCACCVSVYLCAGELCLNMNVCVVCTFVLCVNV